MPPDSYGMDSDEIDVSLLPAASWQQGGYHMEDLPCDDPDAWVIDDQNDDGLGQPDTDLPLVDPNLDVDPMSEETARDARREKKDAFWAHYTGTATPLPQPEAYA